MTLEFKGLTWKLAFGFRGFIGKKKFLGSKGWLAAILDYGGHWLAAIDWRPFWIVAAIFYSHSWTLNVFHRRSHWTCSPYTTYNNSRFSLEINACILNVKVYHKNSSLIIFFCLFQSAHIRKDNDIHHRWICCDIRCRYVYHVKYHKNYRVQWEVWNSCIWHGL